MTIEERIQDLRKQKGLSQEQLAETLGVSRQAVSKWEGGQSLPEVEKLIAMSALFEVTIDYILKGEASQPTNTASFQPSRFASQIASAVATMLLLVGIIAAVDSSKEASSADIYGGLIIASAGIMMVIIGWFLAGGRALLSKPLFIVNVLLAGVLPSMMVPISWLELKGQKTMLTVEWFYRAPGVFVLFTATYIVLCGSILSLTLIASDGKR